MLLVIGIIFGGAFVAFLFAMLRLNKQREEEYKKIYRDIRKKDSPQDNGNTSSSC